MASSNGQYVEERYAADLLRSEVSGVGDLLKDRVMDTGEFVAALRRVAAGGSAIDARWSARSCTGRDVRASSTA